MMGIPRVILGSVNDSSRKSVKVIIVNNIEMIDLFTSAESDPS